MSIPAALLIGVSASASADAPTPKPSKSVSSTCYEPARDQVLTTQQGIELFKACSATNSVPGWHWMGNYGDVYSLANAANSWGAGPGELLTQHMSSGLLATFMYY
ncbi:hypothetical protein ACFY4C_21525 [Actinomadura viridis]|uniref:hypothetical protein n=1 Tax=Actinomadura viridis TaxID=58110 RepID=UPI0036986BF2